MASIANGGTMILNPSQVSVSQSFQSVSKYELCAGALSYSSTTNDDNVDSLLTITITDGNI